MCHDKDLQLDHGADGDDDDDIEFYSSLINRRDARDGGSPS